MVFVVYEFLYSISGSSQGEREKLLEMCMDDIKNGKVAQGFSHRNDCKSVKCYNDFLKIFHDLWLYLTDYRNLGG